MHSGTVASNPEVLFEVNEGKMKNTPVAQAWKAVLEFVGNDHDPNEKAKSKGGKKSGKRTKNPMTM